MADADDTPPQPRSASRTAQETAAGAPGRGHTSRRDRRRRTSLPGDPVRHRLRRPRSRRAERGRARDRRRDGFAVRHGAHPARRMAGTRHACDGRRRRARLESPRALFPRHRGARTRRGAPDARNEGVHGRRSAARQHGAADRGAHRPRRRGRARLAGRHQSRHDARHRIRLFRRRGRPSSVRSHARRTDGRDHRQRVARRRCAVCDRWPPPRQGRRGTLRHRDRRRARRLARHADARRHGQGRARPLHRPRIGRAACGNGLARSDARCARRRPGRVEFRAAGNGARDRRARESRSRRDRRHDRGHQRRDRHARCGTNPAVRAFEPLHVARRCPCARIDRSDFRRRRHGCRAGANSRGYRGFRRLVDARASRHRLAQDLCAAGGHPTLGEARRRSRSGAAEIPRRGRRSHDARRDRARFLRGSRQ